MLLVAPVQFPVHPEPEPAPAAVTRKVLEKLNGSLARNTARLELVELSKATAAIKEAEREQRNRNARKGFIFLGYWRGFDGQLGPF